MFIIKIKTVRLILLKMKTITGKIGEKYKENPIDVEGYVFDSDSANTEGISPKIQRISILLQKRQTLSLNCSSICQFWKT